MSTKNLNKASAAGALIALGIIFGDIGTSPLYVFNAIIHERTVTEELIIGTLSCIVWTLTLLTTLKYVILLLTADNKGEGGTFSLYTLVKRRKKWLVMPAMIGGAALLADGIITPPMSITSAIEGLKNIEYFSSIHTDTIVVVVLTILCIFFFMQQFGTGKIGKIFGPIMFIWFSMLAVFGFLHITDEPTIFKALNPYYAIHFLTHYPNGFFLLGAVFLCATGGEALYSDLGHCGKPNIRVSWSFVKMALLMNYFGQGANLLKNYKGMHMSVETINEFKINSFFNLMPEWFVPVGVIIATTAAIIASQAMVTGAFTLIGEGIRLNFWPRLKIRYPSEEKGQIFIPGINLMIFVGCVIMTLYFKESSRMESAYGLAIILGMISSTILFSNYLVIHRVNRFLVWIFLIGFLTIETAFTIALLNKFPKGGYMAIIAGGIMFIVMYVWFRSRKIKNRYVEFVKVQDYVPQIQEVSNDKTIPKYATHLVYLSSANNPREIEHKIIHSILNRKPKRADIYWFVHVDTQDDPYTCEYSVEHIIPNDIIRVEFRLGFRVEPRVNLLLKQVIEELVKNKEVNVTSRYESLEKKKVMGDFQYVVLEKFLSSDNELNFFEKIIMVLYFRIKMFSLSEERGFGLDSSVVTIEKFPLIVGPIKKYPLHRINE